MNLALPQQVRSLYTSVYQHLSWDCATVLFPEKRHRKAECGFSDLCPWKSLKPSTDKFSLEIFFLYLLRNIQYFDIKIFLLVLWTNTQEAVLRVCSRSADASHRSGSRSQTAGGSSTVWKAFLKGNFRGSCWTTFSLFSEFAEKSCSTPLWTALKQ